MPTRTELRGTRVTTEVGRKAQVEASHLPTDRNDRKARQKAGGHVAHVKNDRRGILSANRESARKFDLAAAYTLGQPVSAK